MLLKLLCSMYVVVVEFDLIIGIFLMFYALDTI